MPPTTLSNPYVRLCMPRTFRVLYHSHSSSTFKILPPASPSINAWRFKQCMPTSPPSSVVQVQHHLALGGAALQLADCLLRLLKVKTLANVGRRQPEREQRVRQLHQYLHPVKHPYQVEAKDGTVLADHRHGVQARPPQPLPRQRQPAHAVAWRSEVRGAKDHVAPAALQPVVRRLEEPPAYRIQDDVKCAAARCRQRLLQLCPKGGRIADNDCLLGEGWEAADEEVHLGIAAHSGDGRGAHCLADAKRKHAHAARGTVHQDALPLADVAQRLEAVDGGEALHEERRALGEVPPLRQRLGLVRRQHDLVRKGAEARDAHHPVAHLEAGQRRQRCLRHRILLAGAVRGAVARDLLHHARELQPGHADTGEGVVEAEAGEDVRKVEANRLDRNAHVPAAQRLQGVVLEGEVADLSRLLPRVPPGTARRHCVSTLCAAGWNVKGLRAAFRSAVTTGSSLASAANKSARHQCRSGGRNAAGTARATLCCGSQVVHPEG
mmetsp:Transcript_34894/g.87901  ORF Transcript_34894/g.87901 Transcript_34894/m.87901 type:complete len:494 (+) Transcript_34894:109-1590(+)